MANPFRQGEHVNSGLQTFGCKIVPQVVMRSRLQAANLQARSRLRWHSETLQMRSVGFCFWCNFSSSSFNAGFRGIFCVTSRSCPPPHFGSGECVSFKRGANGLAIHLTPRIVCPCNDVLQPVGSCCCVLLLGCCAKRLLSKNQPNARSPVCWQDSSVGRAED